MDIVDSVDDGVNKIENNPSSSRSVVGADAGMRAGMNVWRELTLLLETSIIGGLIVYPLSGGVYVDLGSGYNARLFVRGDRVIHESFRGSVVIQKEISRDYGQLIVEQMVLIKTIRDEREEG